MEENVIWSTDSMSSMQTTWNLWPSNPMVQKIQKAVKSSSKVNIVCKLMQQDQLSGLPRPRRKDQPSWTLQPAKRLSAASVLKKGNIQHGNSSCGVIIQWLIYMTMISLHLINWIIALEDSRAIKHLIWLCLVDYTVYCIVFQFMNEMDSHVTWFHDLLTPISFLYSAFVLIESTWLTNCL